jgi:hypothetical protein
MWVKQIQFFASYVDQIASSSTSTSDTVGDVIYVGRIVHAFKPASGLPPIVEIYTPPSGLCGVSFITGLDAPYYFLIPDVVPAGEPNAGRMSVGYCALTPHSLWSAVTPAMQAFYADPVCIHCLEDDPNESNTSVPGCNPACPSGQYCGPWVF